MKKYIVLAFIIGGVLGRVLIPKVQVQEVIRYQKVSIEQKQQEKNKTVVIVETKNPDGSSTKQTTINTNDKTNIKKEDNTIKDNVYNKTSSYKGVAVGLFISKDMNKNILTNRTEYGIITSVPVIGNLSVTGLLTTDKKIGVGLSIEF